MQLLTATGSAAAFGANPTILNRRVQSLTATGSAQSSGSAAVLRKLPAGGLTDFGVWTTGQPDTAMTRDLSHATGVDSTASRGWLTATAPTTYAPAGSPLWNAAVYAGVDIKWASLANGERHSFDNVQVEKALLGNRLSWDATSWEGRRCYTSSSLTHSTVVSTTDTALSGSMAGKITYVGAPPNTWGYFINPTTLGMAPCVPGEIINGCVSVNMQRAAWWSAGIQFYDSSFAQIGGTTWYFTVYQQHPGGGQWDTSYVYGVTAPAGTAYVAVVPHISINSTPSATDEIAPVGEVAYCDLHKVWSRPYNISGTPTTYTTPRKLSIAVQANRVNLVNNPGFDTELWGWGAGGYGTAPFPNSWDSATGRTKPGSLKFSVPANPGSFGLGSQVQTGLLTGWSTSTRGGFGWKPNTPYTNSVYVKLGPNCPTVSLIDSRAIAGVLTTDDALTSHPELIEGEWIRLWLTTLTGASDDGLVGITLSIDSASIPAGGATFWVDDALSEEGDQLLPYFSGSSPGADYLWAGTPNRSSSHYYRAYRSSAYRLNDIVRAAVPHGTQFTLLYAQPPG